jgi:hypothetical protein
MKARPASKLNDAKMKALVHYICDKARDPSVLGSIKLNKVLWYSDAFYYYATGKAITGETYIKRQFGPVPKHILAILEQLEQEKKIVRGKEIFFGYPKAEYISIADPDLSMFSAEEISLVDAAFEHVCLKHTAMSISNASHDDIWKMAEIGEVLPLETTFVSDLDEVDESDVEWAREEMKDAA